MKTCNYCGAPIDNDSQFCTNCGKKVDSQGKTCPQCGAEIEDDAAFCSKCGMRLDVQATPQINTPQVDIPEDSSQKEEIVYEWEEEKGSKWWYIIGGIIVIAIVALGWYFYSPKQKPQIDDSVELTPEKESSFVELIKKWDEMHNNKQFDDSSNCPYAETVYFYGTKMSGTKAAQTKQKAVEKTDYQQESTNIKITRISDKLVVCDFEKHTHSKGKSKVHPDCYLFFTDDGEGIWKIKEESDLKSNKNLQKRMDRRSSSEIIQPITLQFIREYCDYLRLPYRYWELVEKEIRQHNLNVLTNEGPEFDAKPEVLRGSIACRWGKDSPEYVHYYNYIDFCDAVGRIKEVWNVIPVRIENNDEHESPLFQFYYVGNGLDKVLITAQHVEDGVDEMDDIPIYHYKYVTDDNREAKFDLVSY